jgi:ATP-binding cassette subfamily F protein uup
LASQEAELQQRIIEQAADPAAFRELNRELRAVLAAKDDLENRWLEVAEATG